MVAGDGIGVHGVPSFHVHPSHAFEGFELVERAASPPLLLARCECGEVLDVADARFAACPDCDGRDSSCKRCGGTGCVVDHAALRWRAPAQSRD
jgi:hypothetical protein